MILNFLGDSITAGAGAGIVDNMYTTIVGNLTGAKINNYGICGTRIARQQSPSENPEFDEDFLQRAERMDKNADFVFVFGGTNDYGHGDVPIGSIADKTPYTFCGALNMLIDYLSKTYGKDKICFILPLHRKNEDNPYGENGQKKTKSGTLSDYVNAEVEVLDRNGVKYLNMNDLFPLDKIDKLTVDGLHPDPSGHRAIADRIITYLKNVAE